MESIIGALIFAFAIIWMFHIERNTARTSETLKRIEKLLEKSAKEKK